jgi:plasmid stabilization system protein ParE
MSGYQLTPQAQSDIEAIIEYIAIEASEDRAIRVLMELRDEFRKLSETPGMGHFREDLLDRNFKFWSLYSYVIVYRWQTIPIQILAVVHGARDVSAFLSERRMRDPDGAGPLAHSIRI